MREKTTKIEVNGTWYQIGKFKPNVGTGILMKVIGAVIKAGGESSQAREQTAPIENAKKPSPEEIARTICSAALFGNVDQEFHDYVQKECLAVCARLEANDLPMPIATATGLLPDIADDFGLIIRLMLETMVFNFSGFFSDGGMMAVMGQS
jgi:hypothetical protein